MLIFTSFLFYYKVITKNDFNDLYRIFCMKITIKLIIYINKNLYTITFILY